MHKTFVMLEPDLKTMRKTRGMTQEQVGILAGMSKSQISRMESGKLGSSETYSRVLDALGYQPVISYLDRRKSQNLDRSTVLDLLKVYYIYNKKNFGIERIGLFGSFARDEAGPDSDIDILISLEAPSLFRYYTLSKQLETVFGRKIDLISAKFQFQEGFLENIKKDIIYVDL